MNITDFVICTSGPIINGILVYFVVKCQFERDKNQLVQDKNDLEKQLLSKTKERESAIRQRDEAWKILYGLEGSVR